MFSEELTILERVCNEARSEGSIRRDMWDLLKSTFGARFDKAWKLVSEKRIKHYTFKPSGRIAWIAVGRDAEYQLLPNARYCGCDDFYFRIINEGGGLCYHLVAQRLAEALNFYEEISEEDEFFDVLMAEWRGLSQRRDPEN
ncbi:MAG: hypothetical protein ACPL07_02785 [Candidatus Bathyarchaeia archaeon]